MRGNLSIPLALPPFILDRYEMILEERRGNKTTRYSSLFTGHISLFVSLSSLYFYSYFLSKRLGVLLSSSSRHANAIHAIFLVLSS